MPRPGRSPARDRLSTALGAPVAAIRAVTGGNLNDAFEVVLTGGERVLVTSRHARALRGAVAADARRHDEVHPRAEGQQERVALWQLFPLLVHLVLLGGSYRDALGRVAQSLI